MRWHRVAFRVGDEAFTWGDVASDARRRGTWSLEQEIRSGIACRRRARQTGPDVSEMDVKSAAASFRYDRRLVAAEDLEAWLHGRDLTVGEWMGWIRREVARRRWPHLDADLVVDEEEVGSLAWVTGVCSGALENAAHDLAGRAAVRHSLAGRGVEVDGRDDVGDDDDDVAYRRFCIQAASAPALEGAISSRYLDWTVLDCDWATFGDHDVAREALLLVRDDGRSMAEAAGAAGTTVAHRRLLVEEIEAGHRSRFYGASGGDLIGPLPVEEGFAVVAVTARTPPSPADDLVRHRAEHHLVATAVDRQIENRVSWVEHL